MYNQSEVARLRERNDLEIEALQRIKSGFAKVADHETIMYRYRRLDLYYEQLARHVGEEQATEEICERIKHHPMSLSPAFLALLQKRSAEDGSFPNSWQCYLVLLQYADAVLLRAPTEEAAEAWEDSDIDLILEAELEHLARAVATIFPGKGPAELVYYVDTPRTTRGLQDW